MEKAAGSQDAPPASASQLQGFRHWAVAFVVCNFNVDVGPEIELVYPPTDFSTADLTAICFNSFPEQQSDTPGDLNFHFTIRNNSPDIPLTSPNAPHGDPAHLFGSCIFRQAPDRSLKRNFNQKSLVLMSQHEFPAFYMKLLQQLTVSDVISNPDALEAACNQIGAWPPPALGVVDLPFCGAIYKLDIAPHHSFPLQGLTPTAAMAMTAPKDPTVFAYEPVVSWNKLLRFMPSLSELYTVYEKLLLCEPIIVLSKSPQTCSEGVSALLDLIRPVPYSGTIRPFLPMQADFFGTSPDGGIPRHYLIGITNPFLLRRFHTPPEHPSDRPPPYILYLHESDTIPQKPHHKHHLHPHSTFETPGVTIPQVPPKRHFKTDHTFLKTLETMLKGNDASPEDIAPTIRRHFATLTAQFLAPINRYLATRAQPSSYPSPSLSGITSPPSARPATPKPTNTPEYAHFSETEFLDSVAKYGSNVAFKGQGPLQRHRTRDAVYKGFVRGLNFYGWLEVKMRLEREASAGLLS